MIDLPGIEKLRRLQLLYSRPPEDLELKLSEKSIKVSEPPQGVEVLVSGKTSRIRAGLNPQIPVSSIYGNLLTQFHLPNDVIVALLSSLCTLFVTLLFLLVDNFLKSSNP